MKRRKYFFSLIPFFFSHSNFFSLVSASKTLIFFHNRDTEEFLYPEGWYLQVFILSLRLGFVVPREFFCPSGLFELTSRRWLVGQKNSQTKPNFRDRILFMIHGIRGRVSWPGQNASGKSYWVADYSPLENFAFCNYCALKHFSLDLYDISNFWHCNQGCNYTLGYNFKSLRYRINIMIWLF